MDHDRPFSICIYCGSRDGRNPEYQALARELGRRLAGRGWRLVYGGGRAGLMGAVADAAMEAGGEVLGIIPRALMRREVGHTGLTELRVVSTMHERKQAMAEASDAFVALPGGIGTLEEIFEAWTWRHLDHHRRPLALLDLPGSHLRGDGYWQRLSAFLDHAVEEGFMTAAQMDMLVQADAVDPLLDQIWARRDSSRALLRLD